MAEEKNENIIEEPAQTDDTSEEVPYGMMSRIIGVFIEPGRAFRHISEKPEIWGPLLFVFVMLLISSLYTMSRAVPLAVDSTSEMLGKMPGMTSEQIDKALAVTEWMTKLSSVVGTLTIVFGWLLCGLIIYLVCLIMGQDANYKSTLAVTAYSWLPSIFVKSVVIASILLMSKTWTSAMDYQAALTKSSLSLNLLGNADMNPFLQATLMAFDPFLIWTIILLVIGIKSANNVKTPKALTAVIIAYIFILAVSILRNGFNLSKISALN